MCSAGYNFTSWSDSYNNTQSKKGNANGSIYLRQYKNVNLSLTRKPLTILWVPYRKSSRDSLVGNPSSNSHHSNTTILNLLQPQTSQFFGVPSTFSLGESQRIISIIPRDLTSFYPLTLVSNRFKPSSNEEDLKPSLTSVSGLRDVRFLEIMDMILLDSPREKVAGILRNWPPWGWRRSRMAVLLWWLLLLGLLMRLSLELFLFGTHKCRHTLSSVPYLGTCVDFFPILSKK